jgi:hypothetical protein
VGAMRGEEQVQEGCTQLASAASQPRLIDSPPTTACAPACRCLCRRDVGSDPPPPTACPAPPPALHHHRCLCRRDVEERAEQLKAISNLSALIAGFALVSFLQFDFSPSAASEGVQLAFGLTIALTVRPLCMLRISLDVQPPLPTATHAVCWEVGDLLSCLALPGLA